ncbi:TrmH family RNA methyltransferase [Floccifex sp.]|uniref:TrmH family RNA methyltransferase n=1 Tax=Floccifex sp. TaxID=2815810 RepID=UPI003F0C2038
MKIESIQNKKIKERAKLHTKKERDKTNLFIIEGFHLIQEALYAHQLEELFILESIENPFDFPCFSCTQSVINKLSNQISNAKMIGVCRKKEFKTTKFKKILFLDDVQDPGNVGTIVRSAYSFGMDAIFASEKCADVYNLKTIQSTQGALFHLPYFVTNLKKEISFFQEKGIPIYATALHQQAEYLQDIIIPDSFGIVVGNEGQGIHKDIIDMCDSCIKIEMNAFESLNVAIAASICMYTFQYKK